MLALLLFLIHARAGGYDAPGSVQNIEVELIFEGKTQADYTTNENVLMGALNDHITALTSPDDIYWLNSTMPHIHFRFQSGFTFEEHDASMLEVQNICASLNQNTDFTDAWGTLALDCLVMAKEFSGPADTSLNGNCSSGDYAVTGINAGFPVMLNFSRSHFEIGSGNESFINLDFRVPTMYFYSDQNVTGTGGMKNYNRGLAITFHDRWNTTANGDYKYGSCYSTRENYVQCPYVTEKWMYEDDNQCSQRLVGKLPFLDLLYEGNADPDNIIVLNNSRVINGYPTPTWDLYMVAFVETWSGFIQESPLSGNGNLYFNNPYNENSTRTNWDGHLEINAERYSYYILPFRVSWPQMITIDATQAITSAARLIVLRAIITQTQLDINFTPGAGEKFGILHITIQTQTQFPFGLRGNDDSTAPALSKQISGYANGAPVFRSYTPSTDCASVQENQYCYQDWHLTIEPQLCDVSGRYSLEFWAMCFNTTQCALDINAGQTDSNTYSGVLEYEINAQEFCPTILDEIYTQGTIAKYVDPEFLVAAQPGVNLFSNDHVYFEVTFLTRSQKSTLDFSAGDDSLIEYVRPYHIEMEVTMVEEPFQTEVNAENGDVTFPTPSDNKNYVIMLCTANRMDYPYLGNHTDCFSQKGWNAADYLAFTKITSTNGSNTIDANEIAFSLRLDERVMPVDVPNSPITITISVDVEIFYHGNDNPAQSAGRRRLKVELPRRRLQDGTIQETRKQEAQVRDSFGIVKRPNLLYCPLKSALSSAGFALDILMDQTEIPANERDALTWINDMRFGIANALGISASASVKIYQVDSCADNTGCTQVFPGGRRHLAGMRYSRVYVDIKNFMAAVSFQEMIMSTSSAIYASDGVFANKIVKGMKVDHCDAEVQNIINEYRSQSTINSIGQDPSDSSAVAISLMVSMIFALFSF